MVKPWDGRPYYSLTTVADILGYEHVGSLRNAISLGRFTVETAKKGNNRVIYKDSFDKFMDQRREQQRRERRLEYGRYYRQARKLK